MAFVKQDAKRIDDENGLNKTELLISKRETRNPKPVTLDERPNPEPLKAEPLNPEP